jgi:hypothetical protein
MTDKVDTAQVHYKGRLGSIDLGHPAFNLMSFVPFEVEYT